MNTIKTKKEVYEASLEKLGDSCVYAAEFISRIDALHRHRHRVETALNAALTAASGHAVLAGAVLAADVIGIGRTDRIPALSGLGKGRKNATDGVAWDVAIEGALLRLPFSCFVASPTYHLQAVGMNGQEKIENDISFDLVPLRWQISICRRALWRFAHAEGLVVSKPPTSAAGFININIENARQWGELLNILEQEDQKRA